MYLALKKMQEKTFEIRADKYMNKMDSDEYNTIYNHIVILVIFNTILKIEYYQ